MTGQRLPQAYRSRPRPSSALSAKASTVCPCSLDREELIIRSYGVFKVHASRARQRENAGHCRKDNAAGLSKLNSVRTADIEVDVLLGESSDRTAESRRRADYGAE